MASFELRSAHMSFVVPGFAIRKTLRSSAGARVYEVEHHQDGRRAIAKVFALVDDHTEARVRHEFELLRELEVEGVVRPMALERSGDRLVMLLEYIPGRSLAQVVEDGALSVASFLPKAIELSATLARVHAQRIVHRDVKPSNILVEAGTERVLLADFGISVLLANERRHIHEPHLLRGTLPYISPEQTGRTRREVDYRSDLYSLGVTFYEILTGQRPFEAEDPLELLHAQLARPPRPLRELAPHIPAVLEAVVMKLLEKAPERRYQSATGLRGDLERLAQLLATGETEPSFELDERALPAILQFPHQLYGREPEREQLAVELDAILSPAAPGAPGHEQLRVVLIAGEPGMGKSALIRDFEAPLLARGGFIGAGKFELGHHVVPYTGFVAALSGLVSQLLTQSEARVLSWRRDLLEALGPLASVAVTLVPKLSLLLGELPEPPALELAELRTRLHRALVRLVRAFATRAPLVLVLDDLQWADDDSFELLETLSVELDAPALIVGAYRSNEREPGDRLDRAATALAEHGLSILHLELAPLDSEAVGQLFCDILRQPQSTIADLVELAARKTDNNPLFLRQFLDHLVDLELLVFGVDGWSWDVQAIAGAGVPDDVLGVMIAKLERLPHEERALLEIASCIGARFDTTLLAALLDSRGTSAMARELYTLEHAGLIDPSERGYRFAHDRIQEAAHALLDPAAAASVHARIGARLHARACEEVGEALEDLGDRVFAIVDHLGQGPRGEVDTLVELANYAGERALASAAWRSARRYFELSLELLAAELAEVRARSNPRPLPALVRARLGHAVALDLCKDFEAANAAFEELLSWDLPVAIQGELIGRRTRSLVTRGASKEALELGLEGLDRLGLKLRREPSQLVMVVGLVDTWRRIRKLGRQGLLELPDAGDERAIAAMYIMAGLMNAAYEVDAKFFVYMVACHVRLMLREGYHPSAVETLAQIAFASSAFAPPDAVAEMCADIAVLGERRGASTGAVIVASVSRTTFIAPLHQPFRACLEALPAVRRRAVEAGERIMAGAVGCLALTLHLGAGTHLDEFPAIIESFRRENEDWGTPDQAFGAAAAERLVCALRAGPGDEPGPGLLTRAEVLPQHGKMIVYVAGTLELNGRWLLGQREEAWALVEAFADDYDQVMFGLAWPISRFAMFSALLALERAAEPSLGYWERRRLVSLARKQIARLRKWARGCAENFEPMVALLLGELAALRGDPREALSRLENARRLASQTGVHELDAIASLRLSRVAQREGWSRLAATARVEARATFARWGARAVVTRIEAEHPELAVGPDEVGEGPAGTQSGLHTGRGTATMSSSTSNTAVDAASMLTTVSALSEDLRLDEVVARVLRAAIANAGADRGLLLLERDEAMSRSSPRDSVVLAAEIDTREAGPMQTPSLPLSAAGERLPASVVNLVLRSGEPVVIDDLGAEPRFGADPYVLGSEVRSLLCMPIVKHNRRVGALLLENHLNSHAFTTERLEVLRVLMDQAAGILENARLYAALGRSEARWRTLVDGASDLIVLTDAEDRIEFVNHPALLGVEDGDLVGRELAGQLDPAARATWLEARAEVLEGENHRELELGLELGEGGRRWFAVRLTPLRFLVDDELSGRTTATVKLLAIATDVTERRGLEDRLRQQQRLESLGTLAAGVAHEINNPIQGIMNFAELLTENNDDADEVREFAGEIIHESKRVTSIVRNLLAFARHESIVETEDERIEVRELVESALSLIRAVLRRDGIPLELELPEDLPGLRCRPQQLHQILVNLIVNARDALDEFGVQGERRMITIRATSMTRASEPWVRISVIDRGPGIPEAVCARIFEPFFTTKARDKGTGLGLAVSHGIAAEHGGELSVESEPGVGTSFHLDLPAAT